MTQPRADRTFPIAHIAIGATIGRRQQQQDTARHASVTLEDGREALLAIVADGMGGAVGGQIASTCAVDAFVAYAAVSHEPAGLRLRGALNAANDAIADAVAADPHLSGMGSTLVGAIIDGDRIEWISVGDSLLLSVTGTGVQRLNDDHSMGGVLDRRAARGEITAAQAAASDQRHMLRSALIGEPIPLIDFGSAKIAAGARVVVASDGVLSLPFADLAVLVSDAVSPETATDQVVEAIDALGVEEQDNMTIAVIVPAGAGADPSADAATKPEAAKPDTVKVYGKSRGWIAIAIAVVVGVIAAAAAFWTIAPHP